MSAFTTEQSGKILLEAKDEKVVYRSQIHGQKQQKPLDLSANPTPLPLKGGFNALSKVLIKINPKKKYGIFQYKQVQF